MGLIAELKRRNVIRMGGLYLVAAWLIVQVADTVLPMFGAPEWLPRSIVIILAIGLLPALAFSWIFELTPEGLKRDADVPPEQSIAPQTARRMDRLIIATLALALLYFAIDKFVLAPGRESASTAQVGAASAANAPPAPSAINAKSIAVLPFSDFSPAHDQEYFSDGMSEEILNALSQIKDLKVAGRTSSFYYKGRNEDLRSIGKALDVAHVLEGSVRKQGDKVRITAQLIRTQDGFHLWSETYDGDLNDVFALQEEIARAITDKLQVVLSGEQATRLVNAGTEDSEAYALYLQATAIFNRRDGARFPDAARQLQEALRLDPKFARAHARFAALYAIAPAYGARIADDLAEAASQQAKLAIALDPKLAEPYGALGLVHASHRRYIEARKAYEHALAIEGDDIIANTWLATFDYSAGYLKKSGEMLDKVLTIDPMLPIAQLWRGLNHVQHGEIDQAERLLRRAEESGLVHAGIGLSMVAQARGNQAEAIAQLAKGLQPFMRDLPAGSNRTVAEGAFGDAKARAKAIALIDAYLATRPAEIPGAVPYALIRLGQPARALAITGEGRTDNDSLIMSTLWTPPGREARRLPEFSQFVRRMKLAELWDQYGVPDLCRKNDKGDYVCE